MATSYRSTDGSMSSPGNGASRPSQGAATLTGTGIFSIDREGRIRSCNNFLSQFLGYPIQQLAGRDFTEIFCPKNGNASASASSAQLRTMVIEAASAQGEYQTHLYALLNGGNSVRVQFSASLLRDADLASETIVAVVSRAEEASPAVTDATTPTPARGIVSRTIDGTQFILASPIMHEFTAFVDRVAGHAETVLVTGETGTGKELIARTIHESSHRRNRPWVDINCAALPENLVESELFGYEKGAFSGADSSKPGLFELADKGTLFLDEIGELQLHTQVKLLRILDNQPFYRLGGHRKIRVDVRVVAATNQDLEAAVRNGRFRQDLYHRLCQFQLRVPPLRERPEDIVALGEHFLRLKTSKKHFSSQAISALLSHSWPGNIRELRNLVAKVTMESPGSEIDFSKLNAALTGEPAAMRQTASMPVGNLDSMEEQMIIKALERTGGHRTLAAEQLGISRRTLSRKLREYNINFAPGETPTSVGFVSTEHQKFFRARVDIAVTLKNARGEETEVRGVNLSTGGMGLDGVKEPLRFAGLLDIKFILPDSEIQFEAKARLMWIGDDSRVGVRFAVIEPALFEQLQRWTNRKMKEEGWDFPA